MIPTLFISHGPPSIINIGGPVTAFFKGLGKRLPKPKGIVCVSAHWEAMHPLVTGNPTPKTIHDGGPPNLFSLAYPAPGSAELAKSVVSRLKKAGFKGVVDKKRGRDHGTWIPLMLMYPNADIPVVQLSVQTEETPEYHFEMGRALRGLRKNDILIMGSGGAVHNLDDIIEYSADSAPPEYAAAFDNWLEKAVTGGDEASLLNYVDEAPDARRCHPYPAEHFLPFFVALGAGSTETGTRIHKGFLYGTLSMAAYSWD